MPLGWDVIRGLVLKAGHLHHRTQLEHYQHSANRSPTRETKRPSHQGREEGEKKTRRNRETRIKADVHKSPDAYCMMFLCIHPRVKLGEWVI